MNQSTLSSGTLVSSGQSESQDIELTSSSSTTCKILGQIKTDVDVQKQQKKLCKDLHLKRVQSLRKELEYLKSTEWRYHRPAERCDERVTDSDLCSISANIQYLHIPIAEIRRRWFPYFTTPSSTS